MDIEIIYQDQNIIVVNKPAGLLTHPSGKLKNRNRQETLVSWLVKHYPEIKNVGDDPQLRPGIVHRLDKNTSGVLLIARNQKSFDYLKQLFQSGKIKKTYLGLVWGKILPKSGVIKKPIGLKPNSVKRTVWLKKAKLTKEAITQYKVKKYFDRFSLLEIWPLTGRTHQIRVHFNALGHPIVGDQLYGKKEMPAGLNRQFLHAESIELTLPNNTRLKAEADLPNDLKSFLNSLEPESR